MFGWLSARSFFIRSIQAFWFVALAAAERIATSPASPICSAIRSTCFLAMPSEVAAWTYRSRQSGLVSESKVTILTPASLASLSASHSASGSLADTTRALTPCCAAVLMNGTWPSAEPVSGPTSSYVPPNDSTAFLPAASLMSKYGLPRFFGRKVTERSPPALPLPPSLPPSLSLPPQAVTAKLATRLTAARAVTRRFRNFMVLTFRWCFLWQRPLAGADRLHPSWRDRFPGLGGTRGPWPSRGSWWRSPRARGASR